MSEDKKDQYKKKEHQSNAPDKDNYQGNVIEDETTLKENIKSKIQSSSSEKSQDMEFGDDELEFSMENLSLDDVNELLESDALDIDPKLRVILVRIRDKIRRDKNRKGLLFLNNDLAPSLGGEGLSTTSISKEEMKKKISLLSHIRLWFVKRRGALEDLNLSELKSKIDIPEVTDMLDVDQVEKKVNKIEQAEEKAFVQKLGYAIMQQHEGGIAGEWLGDLQDTHHEGHHHHHASDVKRGREDHEGGGRSR